MKTAPEPIKCQRKLLCSKWATFNHTCYNLLLVPQEVQESFCSNWQWHRSLLRKLPFEGSFKIPLVAMTVQQLQGRTVHLIQCN